MIITDDFVFINFPKTGSTFVRKALRSVNKSRIEDPLNRSLFRLRAKRPPYFRMLKVPNMIADHERKGKLTPHGTCAQTPSEHAHKTVLSVVRNPYERLISGYHFGFWKKVQHASPELLKEHFPHFPDLSFEEYVRFSYELEMKAKFWGAPENFGPISASFLQFFGNDPDPQAIAEAIKGKEKLDLEYLKGKLHDVKFLHTEALREELVDFLMEQGWAAKHVKRIEGLEKANVSEDRENDPSAYFTPEMRRFIEEKERLIFSLFPEYAEESVSEKKVETP